MKMRRFIIVFILCIGLLLLFGLSANYIANRMDRFDGTRAFQDVVYQDNLGARIPGSVAHSQTIEWISQELTKNGWSVEKEECPNCLQPLTNIIGKIGGGDEWIILGAHFDSRQLADRDPILTNRIFPVPGANDGASGVAILLELSRNLTKETHKQIWLVFFDAEDNGGIENQDWIYGSRYFVQDKILTLTPGQYPDAAIIVDMVGDRNLNLYYEANSTEYLSKEIWSQAEKLGYAQFIPTIKYRMLDDHTPFLEVGIPSVDIIDFDYPYWHTTEDTQDKVSSESLEAVGSTLLSWLEK